MSEEYITLESFDETDYIMHVGKDHIESSQGIGSGRYRYGSGENPFQHESFIRAVSAYSKAGMSEKQIADALNMNSTEYRARVAFAKELQSAMNIDEALKLQAKGYGATAIGRMMGGVSESTVRGWLKDGAMEKNTVLLSTMNMLKDQVSDGSYFDVSSGSEHWMGVSRDKLIKAYTNLELNGYNVHQITIRQQNTGYNTHTDVLCPPGTTWAEAQNNQDKIKLYSTATSEDGGRTYNKIVEPVRIDQSRIFFKYAEDGGSAKDGMIELRRNVEDLDIGNAHYAQVRIGVNGEDGKNHYLKGMALYSDDIPDGYDILVNSSKSKSKGPNGSMKDYKNTGEDGEPYDPLNPFKASFKQHHYIGEDGKEHVSAANIVREEGEWDTWSKNLASQFLSKQSEGLISRQLDLTKATREAELDEILSVTNPTIQRKLLLEYADDCDASAVHLKAAALPRQTTRVILPIPSLKENEIYAPHLDDGEECVLVRYPHEGIFEIPRLVNNKNNKEGKRVLGNAPKDAVGINPATAAQLSGADFDGDTVLVIPTKGVSIKTSKMDAASGFEELATFDNRASYPAKPGMKHMGGSKAADDFNKDHPGYDVRSGEKTDNQMGRISNLITDMTLLGAPPEHLVRATKHAMVVIDAEKHHLDYEQSYVDQGIAELKSIYQAKPDGKPDGGASTLVSKAKGQAQDSLRDVNGSYRIDPSTGKKIHIYEKDKEPSPSEMKTKTYIDKDGNEKVESSLYYVNKYGTLSKSKAWYLKNGKVTERKTTTTKMDMADDANELLGTSNPKEKLYADYANSLKTLANKARKASLEVKDIEYVKGSKNTYGKQIESLDRKLIEAQKNSPLERMANMIADKKVSMMLQDNPSLKEDSDALQKERTRQLKYARDEVGAKRKQIYIDDDEWDAIQNGGISKSKLTEIVKYVDMDRLRELATPRPSKPSLSSAQIAMARAMLNAGNTSKEVADHFNLSTSTLFKLIDGKE